MTFMAIGTIPFGQDEKDNLIHLFRREPLSSEIEGIKEKIAKREEEKKQSGEFFNGQDRRQHCENIGEVERLLRKG